MGEQTNDNRIGRREMIKRGAVAGGLVWASPMVFSAAAGAQVGSCTNCDASRLFGLKYNNGTGFESLPRPNPNNPNAGQGNCLSATASAPPECFEAFYTFTPTLNGTTHVWVLSPSLELCQAAAKIGQGTTGGEGCFTCTAGICQTGNGTITIERTAAATTVTIVDPALSHSEILFCYRGSPNACISGAR